MPCRRVRDAGRAALALAGSRSAGDLCLARLGLERPFLVAFAAALAIDIARDNLAPQPRPPGWLERAAAWSELATRAAIPLGLYWLRPYLLVTEPQSFWLTVAALAVPLVYAFVKFGRAPRYRTRAAVIAVYLSAGATLFLVATGATPFPCRPSALSCLRRARGSR
jgi:hypothetical protein